MTKVDFGQNCLLTQHLLDVSFSEGNAFKNQLAVAACNHNVPNLQSAQFSAGIICN
jgi:hypothetical protein